MHTPIPCQRDDQPSHWLCPQLQIQPAENMLRAINPLTHQTQSPTFYLYGILWRPPLPKARYYAAS